MGACPNCHQILTIKLEKCPFCDYPLSRAQVANQHINSMEERLQSTEEDRHNILDETAVVEAVIDETVIENAMPTEEIRYKKTKLLIGTLWLLGLLWATYWITMQRQEAQKIAVIAIEQLNVETRAAFREEQEQVIQKIPLKFYMEGIDRGIVIGESVDNLIAILGEPNRKDLSPYGYTWWIYNQDYTRYFQVGVQNDKVVSVYSNADGWSFHSLKIGLTMDEIQAIYPLKDAVSFDHRDSNFYLRVKESTEGMKYLVIDGDLAIEIYLDIHNENRLTSIRLSDHATLLATGGYTMEWTYLRNTAPEIKPPTPTTEEQEMANKAQELQILDLTNSIRVRHQLQPLVMNAKVSDVARGHARDMIQNNFFAHESPKNGKLLNRFEKANIPFSMIAENIAAGQQDAIEAVEAWMNSEGHRINVLNGDYVELGVGVIERHYAQNFLQP
ncbi:hypothetical protein BHU72_12290 [Desulfuribacillus stibiiarsenatis]|uniref:SCP domain-containing protein n=1 Tax=Desulfuribacillus stibiiarsenatis TaxID=1390249 RepID=A0A1E5L242_9FIRM|nr:CAP domain-containing protein [Desulfuribacillus stibiiarsenatis]OEH84176.1 hypothetical protein BHU72_12290 [Desulfuribacillus stibiiarsenatis]